MQHAEIVRAPSSWESLHGNSWKDISWKEKQFEVCASKALDATIIELILYFLTIVLF